MIDCGMENQRLKWQKAGGAARAVSSRNESIARYMKNPNICLTCGKVILVQDHQRAAEVRLKRFCNHSCAARYSNKVSPKRCRLLTKSITCKVCGLPSEVKCKSRQKTCDACKELHSIESISKGELFQKRRNWQSARSTIQRHARLIYQKSGKPMTCQVCGYSHYVEVAHIQPVSSFDDSTKVLEINKAENLAALCPNHHWEYDHGLLVLSGSGNEELNLTVSGL